MSLPLFSHTDPLRQALELARQPDEILRLSVEIVEETFGQPCVVVSLFSGGTDSMLSDEVAREHPRYLCTAQWDTGTGLPVVLEWSREWAQSQGSTLRQIPTTESFRSLVLGEQEIVGGFPGPALHGAYQNRLKDRARVAFQRMLNDEGHQGRPIVYVSGIRAAESETRRRLLKTGPLEIRTRNKRRPDGTLRPEARPRREVHVSPLLYLTDAGKLRAFARRAWRPNPAARELGISAECMCLCHGTAEEERTARAFDPSWGEGRAELEAEVRSAGFDWGPGEDPRAGTAPAQALPSLFDSPIPMCAGSCTRTAQMRRAIS